MALPYLPLAQRHLHPPRFTNPQIQHLVEPSQHSLRLSAPLWKAEVQLRYLRPLYTAGVRHRERDGVRGRRRTGNNRQCGIRERRVG